MPRETILLIDDDRSVTTGLSLLLERGGRTTIACSDIESAELMLARTQVTHLLTDVQFSGAFGFEGLHFLARVRSRLPECRIVLMTGRPTPELRGTALSWGAHAVLSKPFRADELAAALSVDVTSRSPSEGYEQIVVPSLEEIVHGDLLEMVYQPIVSLSGEHPFAFEALARFRGGWPGGSIGELFDYAARRGQSVKLNLATIARAIEDAASLPKDALLFINVDPPTFEEHTLPHVIAAAAARANFSTNRLVLEITERCAFQDASHATRHFDELRATGVRFALDDHGSAYSHLSLIERLAPSFIKISNSFGTDLERDPAKGRIVAHIFSLARSFGCRTIVEGVETADTAHAATALGIELGQGWHFGRPCSAALWRTAGVCA